ncbi:SGNH/GDSL hydrolase family protein [Actinomycetospora sp. CA-053990]|uniref:SGNH/GDSL hydrolase family protein n=1 Tax=Actinomycetospora sp. CA-053990 TaxID=3239891 RepID=UPI003D8A6556
MPSRGSGSNLSDVCLKASAEATALSSAVPLTEGTRTVVALGDSYTAVSRSAGWVPVLGMSRRWTAYAEGFGGSGFVNPGPCRNMAFAQRIGSVLDHRPDVVIVQGGMNDVGVSEDELRAAADQVLAGLHRVPVVVVVGPPAAPARATGTAGVDRVLAEVCATAGRTYISTQNWPLQFRADNIHLTTPGYVDFGRRVASSVPEPFR